jgi:Ser/Thr protein kinase RdoA (MazF antagonist)
VEGAPIDTARFAVLALQVAPTVVTRTTMYVPVQADAPRYRPRWSMGHQLDNETLGAWGAVELLDSAPGGARNMVWFGRVNGKACVVRRSARSDAALVWELDLIEEVRHRGLGAPEIVPTAAGDRSRHGVVIQHRVPGARPASREDWLAVAEYLTTLHTRFRSFGQRPGFVSSIDLLDVDAGGDVDLTEMPAHAVASCRTAWARLRKRETSVVHGDPGEENILMTDDGVVLLDWDESRVDVPLLDLAALPEDASPLEDHERWLAAQAASAWEAAVSWQPEREYARRRLAEIVP